MLIDTLHPVGGRLRLFKDFWRSRLRASRYVLDMIGGLSLPFVRPPPLRLPTPSSFTVLSHPEHAQVVDEEVASMLEKQAIRQVPPSLSYMSRLFLVTKKDGGWRPIINLKRLNKLYMVPPHFRMDMPSDVASLLRLGDWAATIDLKDAYFHLPIHHRYRRYLRFGWKGKIYEFLVLPFGICIAPFIFTKLTKPIAAYLRSRGIRCIFYLDDILVIGSSREECLKNVDCVLSTLRSAGFIINMKKSNLVPSQLFRYLGLIWNTTMGRIELDDVKHRSLVTRAQRILRRPHLVTCHQLQVLLGHLTAAIPAVPLIRLHSRHLQIALSAVYATSADAQRIVPLSEECLRDLRWVAARGIVDCGAPMWPLRLEDCDAEVTTDASDEGWGIYWDGSLHQGIWDADAHLHINVKELMVLRIFLQHFLPYDRHVRRLLWRSDNTTAMAYIRKEGGTRSLPLLEEAREILLLASSLSLRILPVYLPSDENHLADAASRFQQLPDWHLHPSAFKMLTARWGLPDIDLFATSASTHLPMFFAWGEDSRAQALDALAQFWDFRLAYAFPPPPLLPRTIEKFRRSSGNFILVTPHWPTQKWVPMLLDLPVIDVCRLPTWEKLVVDLQTGLPPPTGTELRLVAWLISGASAPPDHRTPASALSLPAGDAPLHRDTTVFGTHFHGSFDFSVWTSIPSI